MNHSPIVSVGKIFCRNYQNAATAMAPLGFTEKRYISHWATSGVKTKKHRQAAMVTQTMAPEAQGYTITDKDIKSLEHKGSYNVTRLTRHGTLKKPT